jgi:hypothetical protein
VPARSFLRSWGPEHSNRLRTCLPEAKTSVRTCPVADRAGTAVAVANADDVAGTAPRDRAHAVTPGGTPRCKNADRRVPRARRRSRNSLADHTAARKNLRRNPLGAGPPAPPPRRTPQRSVRAAVADNAAAARGVAPGRADWPDSVGWHATAATAARLADRHYCNNVLADGQARTAVRTLSKGTADTDRDSRLAPRRHGVDNDAGPREPFTPAGQVSERSCRFAPRRSLLASPAALHPTTKAEAANDRGRSGTGPSRAFGFISQRC